MARINTIIGAFAERKEAGAGDAPEDGGGEAGDDDDSPGSSSSLSDSAIEAVIGFVDVDRSGEVDAKELEVAISAAKQGKLSDPQLEGYMLKIDDELRLKHLRIVDVFNKMDMDGSGTLSHHELAEGLRELCSQDRVKILQRREELRQRKRRLHEEEERKRAELVGFMTNLESLPATMLEGREYFATDITDNDALQALVKTLSEGHDGTDGDGDGGGDGGGSEDKDKDKDTYEANSAVRSVAASSVSPHRTGRPAVTLPGASNGTTNGNMVDSDNGKLGNHHHQQAMKHENKDAGKPFTGENDHGDRKVGLITKTATSDPAAGSQCVPGDCPRGTSDILSVAGREVVHPAQFRKDTKEVDAQLDQLRDAALMRRSARVVLARIGRHGGLGGVVVERTTTCEPVRGVIGVGGDDLAAAVSVRLGEEHDRDAHSVANTDDGTSVGFIRADPQVDAPPGDPTVGDDDGGTMEQGEGIAMNATTKAGIANAMRDKPNNRRRCIAAKRRRDKVRISIPGTLDSKTAFLSRGDDVIERQKKSDLNDPFLRVFLQRQFESERLPFLFAARSASRFHGYTVNDALEMVKRQAGRIPPLA